MTGESVVTAEQIGQAAKYDPQLRIPVRPRVRRGLVVTVGAEEVTVEGGPKRQLFRGRSATELLPRLLELADGSHDHEVLAARLGVDEEIVFKSVSLLWTCGVIEDGPADLPATEPVPDLLADVLSRLGDSTGANPAWEQAVARLRSARVEAFGDPALVMSLTAELRDALTVHAGDHQLPQPSTSLVLSLGDPDPALAGSCWDKNIPLLRLRVAGRRAILGPLVAPGMTPCYDCLAIEDISDDRLPVDGDACLAVALLAREVFALVSRTVPSVLPVRWRAVDLDTLGYSELSGATRPGCQRCSVARGPLAERASLAVRYEAAVAMPPKAYADLKAHQMHYKPSNLKLQQISRTWPVAPAVGLPEPRLDRIAWPRPAGASSQLGAEELSLLLAMIAGIHARTEQRVLRWTASGGNIGSVTAYAVVRDMDGLAPGVYGYVMAEHRLALVSSDLSGVGGDASVTLVLTGDFPKVAQKYGAFALRIVLLDSGCAQTTARRVAAILGVPVSLRPRWDEEAIGAVLGVRPDTEPVTAVIDLGGMP
ncbi:tpaE [Nonomuraea typhae]|uniref:TpaE n=1 Tax=Nonomuraea typhae TaxID=2603600 RepID=A0ABW7YUR7_9ACTN